MMYLIEVYHRRKPVPPYSGWEFSHTVGDVVFETQMDAGAWIAEYGEPGCKHEIVPVSVWRREGA